ncbi:MAG: HAD family hydrolase [Clostridiales bacterium]|nr:HAD family hydrolase [Clostridiales bacterium]
MNTLFISDLDGTLLRPNVELSKRTIRVLNKLIAQGMKFSVATARTIASVKPILKDVTIELPLILMNGACIYDSTENRYIKVEHFSEKSKNLLLSVIKEYQLKGFAYSIKEDVLSTYYEDISTKPLRDFYKERVNKYKKPFIQVDNFADLKEEPLIYFSLMDRKESLDEVYQIFQDIPDVNCTYYKDNYTPDIWYLEIFHNQASKYHAVQYLRDHYYFDSIVCFGDNRNDLPLFQGSDIKIAVANAFPELKIKADIIIGSNQEDGVATWLEKNFRNY